jgi:amino acid adenylation domain-containing protein
MSVVKLLSQLRDSNIHIWLENDRLRYKGPPGAMTGELLAGLKERRTEIIDFLKQVNSYSRMEPAPPREYYPATFAQKRLYILSQLEGAEISYNISGATRIEGKLEPDRLVKAFQKLVQRHEAFRTTFALVDGELVQRIQPQAELAVDFEEVEESRVPEMINRFIRPFDLSRAPLLRIQLLKIAPERHILLYDMHHIISDLMSMSVLVREFTKLYNGELLPELRIQYKDFAYWQNKAGLAAIQKQEQYWLESFAGEIPQADLPTDYPRPTVMNFQGETAGYELAETLITQLKQLAVQRKTTLFMTLLAGYNLFLSRLTGAGEVVVGTTVAGRRDAELENIIGMFVNTLPLKNRLDYGQSFTGLLEEVRRNTLTAFENQDYQYEMLLDKLKIPIDLSRNPLFNTLFNPQTEFNAGNYQFEVGGLKFTPYELDNQTNTFAFDLMILLNETGHTVRLNCIYRSSLFQRATIDYLMGEFIRLLQGIAADPGKPLRDYRVLNPHDIEPPRQQAYIPAPYREFEAAALARSIVERFEEQARQYPGRIAVQVDSDALDYATLNQRANQLARLIRDKQKSSGPVALLCGCHPDICTGIMGVLKGGQAYVPLDPTYPRERLAYMLSDSGASLMVADHQHESLAAALSKKAGQKIPVINISKINPRTGVDNLNLAIRPDQVAYIKYTSGSTGKPKGIPQTHRNVLAFIRRYTNELHINFDDKVALFSSYSHSAGAIDIFSMLLNGGTLYPFDLKSAGNFRKVADWLKAEGITIFHAVPMVYRYCTESLEAGERFTRVRLVVLGGEPILAKDAERLKRYFGKDCVLVNMFGATEMIIGTFGIVDQAAEISGAQVPVGYPVEEVQIYLLNEDNREVPVFGVGEIIYDSDYLALDYLNLPEKSAQSYGPNPLTGKGRVFRSGDLGRILPDGRIEFLGRKDFQVKIRGYRIELGEIEAALDDIPGIHKSIVAGFEKGEGDYYLAAYYTVDGAEPEQKELRRILGQKLPDYMIPSYFVRLEKLPLTPTGKVDRKGLPEPEVSSIDTGIHYEAPENDIEARLVEIWQEVLGIEKVGTNDSFFDLGGHSLNATQVILKIHQQLNVELPLRDIFNGPTVKELAKRIAQSERHVYSLIKPAAKQAYYPISAAQKRMYIVSLMDSGGISYNMTGAIMIEDELDKERLEKVFQTLIARHEAFRTSFEIVAGEPVQRIHETVDFEIRYQKLGNHSITETIREFIRPFDLSKAPLLRVALIELSPQKHIMVYDTHHIIADGTSTGILTEEFIRLFNGEKLPGLRIQYKDYAVWQNELIKTGRIQGQASYWLNRFRGEIPVLNLAADYPRPAVQSFAGDELRFEIEPELTQKLNRMAAETGTTLYMVLLAAFNILLSKYSGQEDIIIGSSIAGRPHADLQKVIGVFINTLAMRNYPARAKTFSEFLAEVKENSLKAYENQDYQFEELVEVLNLQRDLSHNPLFDVMFILQNMSSFKIGKSALKFAPYELENRTAKLDLTLTASEANGKLLNTLEYSTQLFTRETIQRLIQSFLLILRAILADPQVKIADIEVLTNSEKQKIIEDFNQTKTEYLKEKLIHERLAEQVVRTPDRIALQFKDDSLTYQQLNEKANNLAGTLRKQGVQPNCPVGIMVNRSLEMIIGIMAILKAGGAYLPIDPEYPEERIQYVLTDSEAQILLTQGDLISDALISNEQTWQIGFKGAILDINDQRLYQGNGAELERVNTARDLAYIIYTSGSTGQPKGVMIEHQAVHNFIRGITGRIDFTAHKTILALTTISFDIFGLETLLALAAGLKIVIASETEQLDPGLLSAVIIQNRIDMLQITPSRLQLLLSDERYHPCLKNLTEIMIGGEALPESLLDQVRKLTGAKIYNMYGPTETTIWSTVKDLTAGGGVNIGTPIANTQVYIVDPDNRPQPVGVTGELCIAGDGLARGYWKRPELTAEKFVPNPFRTGERMYRTGDLARWLPDGNIEFLGRNDHQVKIRGYRIELGEIENRLLQHEAIQGAAVIDYTGENGLKAIAAYFAAERELTVTELRASLEKTLPDYMIPAVFIQLDKIPQTPNGKIDRKALPKVEQRQSDPGAEYVAPQSAIENELVGIWQELLKCDRVGIRDNFFALGGNSLLVVLMHNRLNLLYPGKVDVTDIFAYPTIARLAQFIEAGEEAKKIQVEELQFPEDYFGSEADGREELTFKFQIADGCLAQLKTTAERTGAGLDKILLAIYVYLLAEVSEQQIIVVQTILADNDHVWPLKIDMGEITDLSSLFQTVKQKYAGISKSAIYDIEQFNKLRIAKHQFGIIPFFASRYDLERKTLAHYDLLLNIQSVAQEEIRFTCNYNQQRLNKQSIEKLINAYLKLIEIIMERMDS